MVKETDIRHLPMTDVARAVGSICPTGPGVSGPERSRGRRARSEIGHCVVDRRACADAIHDGLFRRLGVTSGVGDRLELGFALHQQTAPCHFLPDHLEHDLYGAEAPCERLSAGLGLLPEGPVLSLVGRPKAALNLH